MSKQRGGVREGAGRKHLDGSDPGEGSYLKKTTVSLREKDFRLLRSLGDGNLSGGIRILVDKMLESDVSEE